MRVLFMGTPDFAAASLRALADSSNQVVGVFTQPDKPVGRKHILEKTPVKLAAEELGIPVFQPVKLRDGTAMEIIRALDPELIAVVAYGRILPDDILEYPKYGSINIHGSLLPKYRGAAPIQWSVINGDRVTGVTAMYMASELDSGDIIDTRETEILPEETAGELFERLAPIGAELLCGTVSSIAAGTATRTPQDPELVTYAPPLQKDMAVIDWSLPGDKICSKIRGLDPWPIATAELGGTIFKIYKAVFERKGTGKPCGIILAAGKNGIEVSCGDGSVTIKELQAVGGKRMTAADYLRGHPICL